MCLVHGAWLSPKCARRRRGHGCPQLPWRFFLLPMPRGRQRRGSHGSCCPGPVPSHGRGCAGHRFWVLSMQTHGGGCELHPCAAAYEPRAQSGHVGMRIWLRPWVWVSVLGQKKFSFFKEPRLRAGPPASPRTPDGKGRGGSAASLPETTKSICWGCFCSHICQCVHCLAVIKPSPVTVKLGSSSRLHSCVERAGEFLQLLQYFPPSSSLSASPAHSWSSGLFPVLLEAERGWAVAAK